MGKRPPTNRPAKPARGRAQRRPRRDDDAPPPPPKRKASWPYALMMLLAWGVIFGAVFFSHFLSGLPDVRNLLVTGPSRDVTILDDRGRLIARRGLTQGAMVKVGDLPAYVPNAFIAIEDRRFREHFGIDPIGMARAGVRQHDGGPCGAGRLDPDPATGQEPVSHARPHLRPQNPGSDAGALSGVALLARTRS